MLFTVRLLPVPLLQLREELRAKIQPPQSLPRPAPYRVQDPGDKRWASEHLPALRLRAHPTSSPTPRPRLREAARLPTTTTTDVDPDLDSGLESDWQVMRIRTTGKSDRRGCAKKSSLSWGAEAQGRGRRGALNSGRPMRWGGMSTSMWRVGRRLFGVVFLAFA